MLFSTTMYFNKYITNLNNYAFQYVTMRETRRSTVDSDHSPIKIGFILITYVV